MELRWYTLFTKFNLNETATEEVGKIIESEGGEHLVDPSWENLEKQLECLWAASDFVDCTLAVLVTKLKHDKAAYWFLWSRGLLSLFSV